MNPIALRLAEAEDWVEIRRLAHEQNAAQSTEYELPYPGPHIAVALVGEDEDGIIRQAVVVESVAEMCLYGIDPKATAFSRRDMNGLAFVLRTKGFRWAHCLVPRFLRRPIRKPLQRAGWKDRGDELANFTYELRKR